ncbi:LVIVD repeat-containing protein [Nocardioides iriomotensis]|uniref:LVIVD repeat-containing protein n=1 Tax=Nocardioides iriomotensis TaxID=715784 RepID=A0A4Q5J1E5_9ACTN|nr:hypothetical protein [Nocardioides iriomotensis]RYU12322.1 hypothetical protein ETU37_09930 [Nocardioides iriomotensis]
MTRHHHQLTRPVAAAAGLVMSLVAPVALVALTAAPAHAHGDHDRIQEILGTVSPDASIPLVTSDNVDLVANRPGTTGISGCFLRTAPLFVTSGMESVRVFDVADPANPTQVGVLPNALFENEAMNCGERRKKDGIRRFTLIGVDTVQASPSDPQHVNVGGNELVVVDVTDPTAPRIAGRAPGTTSTHTVACIDETDCRYAYSAGDSGSGTFSIFDLTDLTAPVEVDSDPATPGTQAFASPTAGHKWNFDGAGFGTHTGWDGSAVFDVTTPTRPRLVTTTGAAGRGEDPAYPGWNDFIHHNSFRPNAQAFKPDAAPSFANGNVLLVTEEDYEQVDCAQAGSFQTWWVKRLDGTPDAIVPLDKVELADLGSFPVPAYAFCSAHWFDYHPSGIVSVGFYGGGMQLVDVRDPRDLKPYGHATWGVSEVWDSYWVPVYGKNGVRTGRSTNLVYAVDLVRGLDVYRVDLPGTSSTPLAGPVALGPAQGLPVALVAVALVAAAYLRRGSRRPGS